MKRSNRLRNKNVTYNSYKNWFNQVGRQLKSQPHTEKERENIVFYKINLNT